MIFDRAFTFFREFVDHPGRVGTLVAGSPFLAERLIRVAGLACARRVVELGPGTGDLTTAFLREMPDTASLDAVEISSRFVDVLRTIEDPRLTVHRSSAEDYLEAARLARPHPDVIISGIPFSILAPGVGRRVARQIWESLQPGGCFVTYQVRSHVVKVAREIMGEPESEFEWLNFPPLDIHCWRKPAERNIPSFSGESVSGQPVRCQTGPQVVPSCDEHSVGG